jgi:predicted protein tyrosine phosphatase
LYVKLQQNFYQLIKDLGRVFQLDVPDNFDLNASQITELLKYAEVKVCLQKEKSKTKKENIVMSIISWVCV